MESTYIHVEQTLAIIKPDAVDNSTEIEERILREGFTILQVNNLSFQLSFNSIQNSESFPCKIYVISINNLNSR